MYCHSLETGATDPQHLHRIIYSSQQLPPCQTVDTALFKVQLHLYVFVLTRVIFTTLKQNLLALVCALQDWDLLTVELIWLQWIHDNFQETSLRWPEHCDMLHYPAGSTVHCGCNEMDMVSSNTQVGVSIYVLYNWYKGAQSLPKDYPSTLLDHQQQPKKLIKAGLIHSFLTQPSEYHDRNCPARPNNVFPILYCPILVSRCELQPEFPDRTSWQELHPMWSSAVVDPLLQGLTCCAFTDVCLHTLVVTSSH